MKRMKAWGLLSAATIFLGVFLNFGAIPMSWAGSLFQATVYVPAFPTQTYTIDFNKAEELDNQFDRSVIQQHIPAYNDTLAVRGTVNFRGLEVRLSFPANSNTLTLQIPSIGVNETFTGANRDATVSQLEDWFKKDGGAALSKMQAELVKVSPTDPVAGNPTSLQSNMVTSAFSQGFISTTSQITSAPTTAAADTAKPTKNSDMIGIGARFGSLKAGGLDGSYYSFPLSYSFRSNQDPKKMLTVSLPITVVEVEQATSYNIGLGVGLTWPVRPNWALTPAVQYGFVGSVEQGAVSQMVSGSLTSAYTWDLGSDYLLSMGNMFGYYKTMEFEYQGYKFDPNISNTVFRNGLMLSVPTPKLYPGTVVEVFVIDTRFFGDDLYLDAYDEIGVDFGFRKFESKDLPEKIVNTIRDLRIGVSYLWADGDNSIMTLNFGFAF